jgi:integrase
MTRKGVVAMTDYYRQRPNGRYYWIYKDQYGAKKEISSNDLKTLDKKVNLKRKYLMLEVDIPDMTFQDYMEVWLRNTHMNGKKPKTKNRYWSIFRNHICNNELGLMRMRSINIMLVQRFYNQYMRKVQSSSIIKNIHKLVSPCLRFAYSNGDVLKDFSGILTIPTDADEVIQARIAKSSAKPLTVDQHLDFVEAIRGHELEALFRTSLDGGYRSGELLALTWDDVNFERQRIIINKSYSYTRNEETKKYEGHIVATKNYQVRQNRMPEALKAILLTHKRRQQIILRQYGVIQNQDTLVFCTPISTHLDANNVNKAVKKVYESIGVNWKDNPLNKCFHDLRHTYATRQFEQGVAIITVSKLLGHRNLQITTDTYIHILDNLKDAVADATDSFYIDQTRKRDKPVGILLGNLKLVK